MKPPLSFTTLHNHILTKLLKRKVVRNIKNHRIPKKGHALIYFKTDSLTPGYIFDYLHCNYWEIHEQVRVLNLLGYWVDIVDRQVDNSYLPTNKYDIFLGIGLEVSGRHYLRYAKTLTKAAKILYIQGAHPEQRRTYVSQRQQQFIARHGQEISMTRLTNTINPDKILAASDYVIHDGNQESWNGLPGFKDKIHRIYHSTSPSLELDESAISQKKTNKFLFLAGDGSLLKGLDWVIEAFANMPRYTVHICTTLEPEFSKFYATTLLKAKNIHIEDFVKVGSPKFRRLTQECAFVLAPSASEGCNTAVLTAMRRGLIPIVTKQTWVPVDTFGLQIVDESLPGMISQIKYAASMSVSELHHRIIKTYIASFQYTQARYTESFTTALTKILLKQGLL